MRKPRKPVPDFARRGRGAGVLGDARHDRTMSTGARRGPARLPNLKPSTTAISLRLPVALLERIKLAANQRDVPYQVADQAVARGEARRRQPARAVEGN